jgi:ubiquinone biosynthesis protein UbiJ
MFHAIQSALANEAMQRATLLINHVLAAEPVAVQRLGPHVGKSLRLQLAGWPSWLPPLPVLAFRITPAALVEWCGADGDAAAEIPAELHVTLNASNPAQALFEAIVGERPHVDVAGDAAFATDVNWLFDNLRWDVEDDLAKIVGPAPAREMARLGQTLAKGLREALKTVGTMASRAQRRGQPI